MDSALASDGHEFFHQDSISKQFIFIAFSALQAVLRRNDQQNVYLRGL